MGFNECVLAHSSTHWHIHFTLCRTWDPKPDLTQQAPDNTRQNIDHGISNLYTSLKQYKGSIAVLISQLLYMWMIVEGTAQPSMAYACWECASALCK